MKKVAAAFVISLFCIQALFAQTEKENPFSFGASYIGDFVSNFHGGIKTGSEYLGKANLTVGFDTEKAQWWKGGELFINGMTTHGGEPSATLIGDFQKASNIDAGDHIALYELWYKQTFGKFDITAGLQDLNVDYAVSESGLLFNNSYFGIHSVCSENIPVPIFPLTALGLNVGWNISDDYRLQAVVFDGVPDDFSINPYNVKWTLSRWQGFLALSEFQVKKSIVKGRGGVYKIGFYLQDSQEITNDTHKNYGFYLVADQEISDQITLFMQTGTSPKKWNNHYFCYGLGMNWKNFNTKRPNDIIGLAFNHARFKNNPAGNETVVELIYHFQLNKNSYLCPDLQYIANPAGTGEKLQNALVGMLRFGIEF
ncbi:porin [Bacteroidia bacterium]|nr:porin [Bacteroidia bacterium]